jgi:hypothetical protein
MENRAQRHPPGQVRDAILQVMSVTAEPLSVRDIEERVCRLLGSAPTSSIRSYLRLNTPEVFQREKRGLYSARGTGSEAVQLEFPEMQTWREPAQFSRATMLIVSTGWGGKPTRAFMRW